jgi:hypothetical protein
MRKKFALWTMTVIAAFTLGNTFSIIMTSGPSVQMESDMHYCKCVEEHPELYPRLLDAADVVQRNIDQQTAEFIAKHQLKPNDFQGIFVPQENGNYNVYYFCSHRNRRVTQLEPEFIEFIRPSLQPYKHIVREAHGENF